ncbi:MAG: rhomboid family intramembrane serine protease [Candidatus Aminicenantes bacterium]|nr:rhomboid family intramembrane serine protease [Candidatus Aminicenantes bacterium]NIM85131.1 rhomboid family intramembrane serine protease [Candidatus Aminicenantes bacterium]NIN24641.1 rhomboid family intramembrane serine protease [Candidatus Aminicenantes bacterium]NIN48402.1 rhomboid family intramembrane serine protease [Candidatus Aminicenantes bacterium]NIN91305.1 rhomboid family intramembrane serine protease [Candidatus Aminicenantes bacterium]
MIIPYGIEDSKLRRIPVVTIAIIVICIVVYYFTSLAYKRWEVRYQKAFTKFISYYMAHPYLEISPEFKKQFMSEEDAEVAENLLKGFGRYKERPDDYVVEEEQEKFDEYVRELLDLSKTLPFKKWGFIPAKKNFGGLFSSMFVHAGFWHLFFNLLLLFVCGPLLEDVWGRLTFVPFYLLSGIVATLMYSLHYPGSTVPLVGASGAIAGVMGAFLVRHFKTNIKFFYFFFIFIRPGTFSAPAWLMLPLWLLREIFAGSLMDVVIKEHGGGGVAHWAHVWGFAFGAGIAYLIKHFKLEEKYVKSKIEKQTTYVNKGYTIFEEAQQLLVSGDKENAFIKLKEAAGQTPSDQDIVETLWNTSIDLYKEHEAAPYLVRLIEKDVRDNEMQLALLHYSQLKTRFPDAAINKHAKIKLLNAVIDVWEFKDAKQMYDELAPEINLNVPPGILLEFSSVALKFDQRFDQSVAGRVVELALQHPDIPEDKKDELKTRLYAPPKPRPRGDEPIKINGYLGEGGAAAAAGAAAATVSAFQPQPPVSSGMASKANATIQPPPPPPEAYEILSPQDFYVPERKLNITKAVPVCVKGTKIVLNAENVGQRAVSLERVQFISVVKIAPPSGRPFLLLDFFLSNPNLQAADIRLVRFFSSQFNPQKFAPNASGPMEAFKTFVSALLELSGAQPYPDLESVQLNRLITFTSIEEYDNSLLKTG